MGKKKMKVFDPFDAVVSHGSLTIGTIGVMGLADRMPDSPSKAGIIRGMDTMKIIPVVHGAGIAMGSLGMLGDVEKRVKKRR